MSQNLWKLLPLLTKFSESLYLLNFPYHLKNVCRTDSLLFLVKTISYDRQGHHMEIKQPCFCNTYTFKTLRYISED